MFSCQEFLSSKPHLQAVASIFSCVKHLELVILYILHKEHGNSSLDSNILSTSIWKRRISTIIAFVKVFEYDHAKCQLNRGILMDETGKTFPKEQEESSEIDFWREGLDGFLKNGDINNEEIKSSKIIEVSELFWAKIPEHYRKGNIPI